MNSANTPLLETERLILRKFTENDLEALFNIYSNEEVNTYLPWFPLTSLEEAASLFKETALRVSLRHLPEKQQPSGRVYPRRHGRQP